MCNWLFRGAFPDAVELALGPLKTGANCCFELRRASGAGHGAAPIQYPEASRNQANQPHCSQSLPSNRSCSQPTTAEPMGALASALFLVSQTKGNVRVLLIKIGGALTENWYFSTLLIYSFILPTDAVFSESILCARHRTGCLGHT